MTEQKKMWRLWKLWRLETMETEVTVMMVTVDILVTNVKSVMHFENTSIDS